MNRFPKSIVAFNIKLTTQMLDAFATFHGCKPVITFLQRHGELLTNNLAIPFTWMPKTKLFTPPHGKN